jgi:aldehyde dehydrogenase (NAD+)
VHIAGKLAPAIATGTTVVIKPSEYSAIQTQVLLECIHAAGVPTGVVNVVNGLGNIVGHELSVHPDIASISFTGSTQVGKIIAKNAVDSMKRVALELGGKSPNILLDDADLDKAIPMALTIGFSNSGQACHAGTRLIVPASRTARDQGAPRQSRWGLESRHTKRQCRVYRPDGERKAV